MAPSPLQQRRTHNTLLFQKLLNLRDGASPFTLVLDSLEQSGGVVVREFVRRAKISKSKIIYISYTTLRPKIPFEIDIYIRARGKPLSALRSEITAHLPSSASTTSVAASNSSRYLLILDTLTPLCTSHPTHISNFLSSLLISPQISLLATCHTDIPISASALATSYHPNALTTLLYLATAILSVSSLSHILAAKRARDKSVQEPVFGLLEKKEGVLFALTEVEAEGEEGVVVNMEIRRRSGRGVCEDFVLLPPKSSLSSITKTTTALQLSSVVLLDEHPLFAPPVIDSHTYDHTNSKEGEDEDEGTFSLHLTEKQKRDRDNIILPYFDAQKDGGLSGVGEGGRILYEMGAEDREDFDDEEDEV